MVVGCEDEVDPFNYCSPPLHSPNLDLPLWGVDMDGRCPVATRAGRREKLRMTRSGAVRSSSGSLIACFATFSSTLGKRDIQHPPSQSTSLHHHSPSTSPSHYHHITTSHHEVWFSSHPFRGYRYHDGRYRRRSRSSQVSSRVSNRVFCLHRAKRGLAP